MSGLQQVLYALPDKLSAVLYKIDKNKTDSISEIRLRVNQPIAIRICNKIMFVNRFGVLCNLPSDDSIILTNDDMCEAFGRLCEHSLYSKQNTLSMGYVVMRSGCRAGVCGDFTEREFNLRQASSINIRIAHQIRDADYDIYKLIGNFPQSVLIVGAPHSGKTTVLRELCRRYSNMLFNVCVLDEKNELTALNNGICAFDVGVCSDVISNRNKADSASIALKLMNPDIIAFDELADDCEILKECSNCGVKIFSTMHANSVNEAIYRMKYLGVDITSFDLIVVLDRTTFGLTDVYQVKKQ